MLKPEELRLIRRVLSEFQGDGPSINFAFGILSELDAVLSSPSPSEKLFSKDQAAFLIKLLNSYKRYPVMAAPFLPSIYEELTNIVKPKEDVPTDG